MQAELTDEEVKRFLGINFNQIHDSRLQGN
jgi:hypothetical protein